MELNPVERKHVTAVRFHVQGGFAMDIGADMSAVRKPSYSIKPSDIPSILDRIRRGEFLNRIAADLDVNPGRIAEIKKKYLGEEEPRLL